MDSAFLFGYKKSDPDRTGYVRVSPGGRAEVVDDNAEATRFEAENASGKKGWGSPEQWCGFFNEELPEWAFHVVPAGKV